MIVLACLLFVGCITNTEKLEKMPYANGQLSTTYDDNYSVDSLGRLRQPEFLSFQELKNGVDALSYWYLVFKTGNMSVGREDYYRFFRFRILTQDKKLQKNIAINALNHQYGALEITANYNTLVLKNTSEVEDRSHHEIFGIVEENLSELAGLRASIFFEVSSIKTSWPTEEFEYYFSLDGNISNNGIFIDRVGFGRIQTNNIIQTFREISKIRERIKQIYVKEDNDYILGENGKWKSNPKARLYTDYDLGDKELAEKVISFGNEQLIFRYWAKGEKETAIKTDAYSDEIAAVVSYVKLVEGVNK